MPKINTNNNFSQEQTRVPGFLKPPDERRQHRSLIIKRILIGVGVFVLIIIGFYAATAAKTLKQIQLPGASKGGFSLPIINTRKLQGESDNRINILLVGIGGAKHPGGQLADTIMWASVNPTDKKVALLSIPRDLQVPLPKPLIGDDKINAAHSLGEQQSAKTGGGPRYLKKTVAEVFGQPIHYLIRVDFEGFLKLVDALGGITVNVEKSIYDPFFPAANMVDYEPFSIKQGVQTLDGTTALKYARSRYTTSDFDRASRQQQVIQAIRDKVLGLNVLANPKKIVEIGKIVGDHIKTDLEPWEIERLAKIALDVPKENVASRVLDNGPGGALVSVSEGGYYLKPKDGTYQELKEIAKNIFTQSATATEQSKIEIINASKKDGLGSQISAELTKLGFTVVRVSQPSAASQDTLIYDATNGKKPESLKILKRGLKVDSVVTAKPPSLLNNSTADFVIILGQGYIHVLP